MQNIQRLKGFAAWLKYEHFYNKNPRQTYDKISENADYDGIVDFDGRSGTLEKLTRGIKLVNKRVLDIACGSGAFISAVVRKNPGEIVGVDISGGMLKLARERFRRNKKVRFINKSFMDVNFKRESFDLILLANASRYIPKGKEKAFFNKVKKWLKKDGVFIIHSDFWNGLLGKLLAPVIFFLSNKSNINPNTTFAWNLEKELKKYFVIKRKTTIGWEGLRGGKHMAFICER